MDYFRNVPCFSYTIVSLHLSLWFQDSSSISNPISTKCVEVKRKAKKGLTYPFFSVALCESMSLSLVLCFCLVFCFFLSLPCLSLALHSLFLSYTKYRNERGDVPQQLCQNSHHNFWSDLSPIENTKMLKIHRGFSVSGQRFLWIQLVSYIPFCISTYLPHCVASAL